MTWLYLAPDLALSLLLCRMVMRGLYRSHAGIFVALYAWLAYSALSLFYNSPLVDLLPWIALAPALWRASRRLRGLRLALAAYAPVLAAALAADVFHALGNDAATRIFTARCAAAFIAGAVFLLARAPEGSAERTLWRGVGAYFLFIAHAYSFAAVSGAAFWLPLMSIVTAATWITLWWHIGQHGEDALLNLDFFATCFPLPTGRRAPTLRVRTAPPRSGTFGTQPPHSAACAPPSILRGGQRG